MRARIKTGLLAGFGTLLLLVVLLGWFGWQSESTIMYRYDMLFHRNVHASVLLSEAKNALWQLRFGVANYMLVDEAGRASILAEESKWFQQIDSKMSAYRSMNLTSEEMRVLRDWDNRYAQYRPARARLLELYRAGRFKEALRWRSDFSSRYAGLAIQALEHLIDRQQHAFFSEEQEIDKAATNVISTQIALVILLSAIGAIVAYYVSSQVMNSARALARAHSSLEEVNHELVKRMEALRAAEEQARSSEAQVKAIIEVTQDGIVIVDRNGLVQEVNPAMAQILDRAPEEMIGLPFLSLLSASPPDLTSLKRSFETTALRRMGEEIPVEVMIYRLNLDDGDSYAAFLRNLSESRQAEVEERQAQKLEAIGRLAAGIAHEINTPIQFIGDSACFLETAYEELHKVFNAYQEACATSEAGILTPQHIQRVRQAESNAEIAYLEEQIPEALGRIREGSSRVASIVRAMKEFAHPDPKEMTVADLNRAILNTLTIARNELKYAADVETDLGELPPLTCHIGDLNQVILNLLVNAAHAIEDKVEGGEEKGAITIRTICKDDVVLVSISDTGCGIPKEIQHKIFDPFFTSKEVGRGSGQGLAISRSVIERHGGKLTFESEAGKGTTFYICLPIDGHG